MSATLLDDPMFFLEYSIHGTHRTVVLSLIQQVGKDLPRTIIVKPFCMEQIEHCLSLFIPESQRRGWPA